MRKQHSPQKVKVLIESDWNLKKTAATMYTPEEMVLIESDWNLKEFFVAHGWIAFPCINRIRLEFKVRPAPSSFVLYVY